MNERDATRAKILGVLMRDARQHAGRTPEECAGVLRVTPEQYRQAEEGQYVVSLPQLEVLAMYLDVPMAHFWGTHTLEENEEPDYGELLKLRHKIVGGLVRHARLKEEQTPEALAGELGVDVERIRAYEAGEEAIPYLHLEKLANFLGVSIDYFMDDERGPLGRHEAQKRMERHLDELPPDVREFVAQPVNVNYIQTAMRLSEMDADRLRTIAESLLDITL
ncbi:MAG: helix-turn-helix domain-containing protein [Candidatus Promineifilaceae bacterium]|nr:helix-turn-helix domain-containing protein [Candidatus Promineifilaceae bacterium]